MVQVLVQVQATEPVAASVGGPSTVSFQVENTISKSLVWLIFSKKGFTRALPELSRMLREVRVTLLVLDTSYVAEKN
jgi:hypothetical protein